VVATWGHDVHLVRWLRRRENRERDEVTQSESLIDFFPAGRLNMSPDSPLAPQMLSRRGAAVTRTAVTARSRSDRKLFTTYADLRLIGVNKLAAAQPCKQ